MVICALMRMCNLPYSHPVAGMRKSCEVYIYIDLQKALAGTLITASEGCRWHVKADAIAYDTVSFQLEVYVPGMEENVNVQLRIL